MVHIQIFALFVKTSEADVSRWTNLLLFSDCGMTRYFHRLMLLRKIQAFLQYRECSGFHYLGTGYLRQCMKAHGLTRNVVTLTGMKCMI
jgi:hypothetical protein